MSWDWTFSNFCIWLRARYFTDRVNWLSLLITLYVLIKHCNPNRGVLSWYLELTSYAIRPTLRFDSY